MSQENINNKSAPLTTAEVLKYSKIISDLGLTEMFNWLDEFKHEEIMRQINNMKADRTMISRTTCPVSYNDAGVKRTGNEDDKCIICMFATLNNRDTKLPSTERCVIIRNGLYNYSIGQLKGALKVLVKMFNSELYKKHYDEK